MPPPCSPKRRVEKRVAYVSHGPSPPHLKSKTARLVRRFSTYNSGLNRSDVIALFDRAQPVACHST